MRRLETLFVELNKWALILLLAAMAVIVFTNVSLRYLTNFSLTWAEEVARYLMVWMTFLGAGLALRSGGHVAITTIVDLFGPRVQQALRGLVAVVLLVFFVAMIWYGHEYMTRMGRQLTPATRIPFWYIYMAIPLGFGLLLIHFLLILKAFVLGSALPEKSGQAEGRPPVTG